MYRHCPTTKGQGHRAREEATLGSKSALLFPLCSLDWDHTIDGSALPAEPQLDAARQAHEGRKDTFFSVCLVAPVDVMKAKGPLTSTFQLSPSS